MATLYVISHTDTGIDDINVSRRTLDVSTNLSLYGPDSVEWGDGWNTNFLHLLENFSSPGIAAGSPATYTPDPTYLDPTKAQVGQAWFNSTNGKLSVYDGTTWNLYGRHFSGSTAPTGKEIGDTWFDTTGSGGLKALQSTGPDVWTGVAGDAVLKAGDTMTGLLILSGDPAVALGAATKQYVDNGFLPIGGGTLTGTLTLDGDPSGNLEAATKQYVDAGLVLLQKIYPVGGIYFSVNATDPNTVLGFGTWTAMQNSFLVGAGGTYTSLDTGGSADAVVVSHTHTASQSQHRHSFTAQQNIGGYTDNGGAPDQRSAAANANTNYQTPAITVDSAGVSGTNANLPPYLAVHMWRRTA